MLEVIFLLHRLLPTLCPETISHFYVGMRPPAHALLAAARGAAFPGVDTVCSVPWLFSAMPLPQPVAGLDVPFSADGGEADGGDSDAPTEEPDSSSDHSADHAPDEQQCPQSPADGGFVGAGGQHDVETTEGAARGEEKAVSAGDVSLRFVCQVEAARLLATTAMGVLGDENVSGDGGREADEGGEECARVLKAGEAFFAAFERTYAGCVCRCLLRSPDSGGNRHKPLIFTPFTSFRTLESAARTRGLREVVGQAATFSACLL